jgi:hypothetical protein
MVHFRNSKLILTLPGRNILQIQQMILVRSSLGHGNWAPSSLTSPSPSMLPTGINVRSIAWRTRLGGACAVITIYPCSPPPLHLSHCRGQGQQTNTHRWAQSAMDRRINSVGIDRYYRSILLVSFS